MPNLRRISASLAALLVLTSAFASLLSVGSVSLYAVHSECSDGLDNDENGKYDYPQDDGCSSLEDDYEGVSHSGNFVTLTDGREKIQPGDAVVYVITLKQQRETNRNVSIDLHLPAQMSIVSASDGGAINGGNVRWTNVSVYKNATRTLQVHVNIRPDAKEGQYLVARTVVQGGEEATDTTLVEQYQPVAQDRYRVYITDGLEYALPGQELFYVVKVKNIATYATVTDVRATMPYDALFETMSDGGIRDNNTTVVWKDVPFNPGEQREFAFTARLDQRATDRLVIRARASAGTINNTDQTVVRIGLPYDALTATITDQREEAELGQILTYTVRVQNRAKYIGADINVGASMPLYAEFVSATEGGSFDGAGNIRWLVTGIAPAGERILQYSIRVRSDAPLGAVLTAGVTTDGASGNAVAQDRTTVVRESLEIGYVPPELLFRKVADRGETMPGGVIRYTITMKNTLSHVISDAVIVDKFDSRYLSLSQFDRQSLIGVSSDRMEWKVPVLKPGESWQTSYTLAVSESAPHGFPLENVATLRGADVSSASLTQRVWTGKAGVITQFPTTGAAFDGYLLGLLALMALGTAGSQLGLKKGLAMLG